MDNRQAYLRLLFFLLALRLEHLHVPLPLVERFCRHLLRLLRARDLALPLGHLCRVRANFFLRRSEILRQLARIHPAVCAPSR